MRRTSELLSKRPWALFLLRKASGKRFAKAGIKLMLIVIEKPGYKPKWDAIQAAMDPRFSAEGNRQAGP